MQVECPAKPKRAPTPDILKGPQRLVNEDERYFDGSDGADSELEHDEEVVGDSDDSDDLNANL